MSSRSLSHSNMAALFDSMERLFYTLHQNAVLHHQLFPEDWDPDINPDHELRQYFTVAIQGLLRAAHGKRTCQHHTRLFKTPEMTIAEARKLLASIRTVRKVKRGKRVVGEVPCPVGLRDRAIMAILVYTAARAGAVSKLQRGSFYHAGDQWMLRFEEKNGKSREIPVRQDLQGVIAAYVDAAGLRDAPRDARCSRPRSAKREGWVQGQSTSMTFAG